MKRRIESLARLGDLQARMASLGRWRLSAIERERSSLDGDLKAAFEALEASAFAYGEYSRFGARRVAALQRRLEQLARDADRVRRKAEAHGRSARLAERAAETADRAWRDRTERRRLADLVERAIAARRHASST
jgi:hypothetical protein